MFSENEMHSKQMEEEEENDGYEEEEEEDEVVVKPKSMRILNPRWTVIPKEHMNTAYNPPENIFTCRTHLPNGTILQSNILPCFNPIGNDLGYKYFLIDQDDMKYMSIVDYCSKTEGEKILTTKRILNRVQNLCTYHTTKRIYIRTLPNPRVGLDSEQHLDSVFAEEILEMIPALLLKQGKPIEDNDERLNFYRKVWKTKQNYQYRTITLNLLERVFDEFAIDMGLVTLVRDPLYELTNSIHYKNADHIFTLGPDFKIASDPIQIMNVVFLETVMGINFQYETCKFHEKCLETIREKIMKVLCQLHELPKTRFLDCQFIEDQILKIKENCRFKYPIIPNDSHYHFRNRLPEFSIRSEKYIAMTKEFGIPRYLNFLPNANKRLMPVWLARVFYKLGVIEKFFGGCNDYGCRNILIEILLKLVPRIHFERTREVLSIFMKGSDSQMLHYCDPAGGQVAHQSFYEVRDSRTENGHLGERYQ